MNDQNLQFNILPFDWPEEEVSFYFHRDVHPNHYRLHQRLFPNELGRIYPGIEEAGAEFVATSFDRPAEGFVSLDIDLQYDKAELARRYFHYKVYTYFQGLGNMVVRRGFAKGVQVWVPAFKLHTEEFLVFECFRLRVQMGSVRPLPELLVRYEREVKVCRRSVAQMIEDVPPALFQWLLVGNRLVRYADYVQEEETDFGRAFPVLNKEIRKVLGMPASTPDKGNPYQKHWRYIKGFYSKFLDNEAFREVIPIQQAFLGVDPEASWRLPYTVKEQPLEGGAGMASKAGGTVLRPYKKSPHAHIHLFFIVHRQDAHLIERVKRYFFKGVGQFKGMSAYAQLHMHPQKDMDIIFDQLAHPLQEITMKLDARMRDLPEEVTYIAVYISPYSHCEADPRKSVLYYFMKYELLNRKIPMQVLDAGKLRDPKVAYEQFMPGISVAMLAKLDGIPWRMRVPVQNELIFGVGTFSTGVHSASYLVAGLWFSNEGRFERFECFHEQEAGWLAGFISSSARKYAEEYQYPRRLVIHVNRKGGRRELALLERALARLQFPKPIPVFIVSVYGTASEDVLAFDTNWCELMPCSGTVVKVGVCKYLLFHNERYARGCFDGQDGFPLPVKVGIDCTDKELLKDEEVVLELLGQVHQFSRMYWRGVGQQNLPVTVKYAEMMARMVGHFPGGRMPEFGKRMSGELLHCRLVFMMNCHSF